MTDDCVERVRVRVLPDGRISARDNAKLFNRSDKTMAHWRMRGWGPKPIIVGGRVFHDYAESLAMARGEKPVKPAGVA